MKRIVLIRHCHATGQHKDSPLSKLGNNQAYHLAIFLQQLSFPIDRILSSPYLRAIETIRPFAQDHNIKIETDERLQERLLSEEPIDDWLEILEASFDDFDFKLPGGESSQDAFNRAEEIVSEIFEEPNHENIALVTHGNLLTLLLRYFQIDFGFKQWTRLTNPDVFIVQKIGGEYVIEHKWQETN
ncbi:histidine phosphatase family protein [Saliterribacillus persicus]|uniref:2,3-bisphosphoglycerate-dependent phosphoglycerate mutase n=1 Tax=Saliterribacillus persicus TaxID=930114 RepID=A0A368XCL9_9BACI|nr:histidine phosphatase family protein [Saliterribacillus persicus]RCW64976.1 2,3-bisphosphoglycerate-dependent phosphoglycerate mutase [Saliterribacillus persicus]